jgi:hypothetical protein
MFSLPIILMTLLVNGHEVHELAKQTKILAESHQSLVHQSMMELMTNG